AYNDGSHGPCPVDDDCGVKDSTLTREGGGTGASSSVGGNGNYSLTVVADQPGCWTLSATFDDDWPDNQIPPGEAGNDFPVALDRKFRVVGNPGVIRFSDLDPCADGQSSIFCSLDPALDPNCGVITYSTEGDTHGAWIDPDSGELVSGTESGCIIIRATSS